MKKIIALILVLVFAVSLTACGGSGSSSSSSKKQSETGAGGYDMPNESDESFSDYVERVDPDLYNEMSDRYDSLDE